MQLTKRSTLHNASQRIIHNDEGATSIEYAFIAASIGFMLIVAMPGLASSIESIFSALASGIAGS